MFSSKEISTLTPNFKNYLFELGKELLQIQQSRLEIQRKEDGSAVCNADLYADEKIHKFLSQYPYPIISEERDKPLLTNELTWVVDPIDGTSSYIDKKKSFSVMIGLLHQKKPLWGMVYLPAFEHGYYAIRGEGSFFYQFNQGSKEKKLQVRNPNSSSKNTLLANKKEMDLLPWEQTLVSHLNIEKIENMGSIGIKLAKIAHGEADYYFNCRSRFGIWDLVAPLLILEEAGGDSFNSLGDRIEFLSDKIYYPEGLLSGEKENLQKNLSFILENLKNDNEK